MTWTTAALCAALLVADDAAKKELVAAATKLAAAPNYTVAYDDGSGAEPGRDEPHGHESPQPSQGGRHKKTSIWTIQWSKEQPSHFTRGRAEFWRLEHKYVALGRNDAWMEVALLDPKSRADVRGMERMVLELDRLQLPHQFLADVERKLADVARSEHDGAIVFEGALDEKLARQMLGPPKDAAGKDAPKEPAPSSEKPAAPAPAPRYSGKVRVTVAGDAVRSLEIELAVTGIPDAKKVTRRFDLSAVGTTKIDVPEPASKLLHGD